MLVEEIIFQRNCIININTIHDCNQSTCNLKKWNGTNTNNMLDFELNIDMMFYYWIGFVCFKCQRSINQTSLSSLAQNDATQNSCFMKGVRENAKTFSENWMSSQCFCFNQRNIFDQLHLDRAQQMSKIPEVFSIFLTTLLHTWQKTYNCEFI